MLNQWRIAHQLWLAVAFVITMLVLIVGFSGYRTAMLQTQGDAVSRELGARLDAASLWMGLTQTNAARTQALVTSSDPAVEATFKDVIAATSAQISEVQKSIEAMALTEADKAQMAKVAAARKAMIDLRGQARKLKAEGQHEQAMALIAQSYNPATSAYLQTLRDFVQMQRDAAQAWQQEQVQARAHTAQMAAAAIVVLVVLIALAAFWFIRGMQRSLAQAAQWAERIAQGDLSATEKVTRGDEFGDLLRSLQIMASALGRVVSQVRQSTDSIATASAEIASGNHDLSVRTEQTSSNLQQTASAMDQFASTIGQSASSAQQASSLAVGASAVAQRGGEVVAQVVSTMHDIHHSSQKIADIIGVIDGIAFQTNILALNAAVEAARAGEQGRGFAVVASEVRGLAQRSAAAAKEIKTLIDDSVAKVGIGTQLVERAGTTMGDVVQGVKSVTAMVAEISAASSEQSAGIAQVNQAVTQMDQGTQQNAALVEEALAAVQSLSQQALALSQVVGKFRVA